VVGEQKVFGEFSDWLELGFRAESWQSTTKATKINAKRRKSSERTIEFPLKDRQSTKRRDKRVLLSRPNWQTDGEEQGYWWSEHLLQQHSTSSEDDSVLLVLLQHSNRSLPEHIASALQ
jgi:hypothetical protein